MSNDGHMLVTFGAINEAAMDTDSIAAQIAQQLSDLKTYLAPWWRAGRARPRPTSRPCRRSGTKAPRT